MKNYIFKSKKKVFILILSLVAIEVFAEKIYFSANSMSGKSTDDDSVTVLKGSSYIKTETMEINAGEIELSGDDYRYIKASDKIKGKNLETNMTFSCDEMEYDRETKVAILKGNVSLIDTDNDVTAKAQRIEYNQDKEIAILQIDVNLVQKSNVCTGAHAIYYKNDKILDISGNAQVSKDGDVFRAQNIHFNMDTEDIVLGGNVKGSVSESQKSEG